MPDMFEEEGDGRAKTCATCRWWTPPTGTIATLPGFGACQLTELAYGHKATYPESLAISEDHDGYFTILKTKPEFSCNQWQAGGSDGS